MISLLISLLFGAQLWLLASSFLQSPRLSLPSVIALIVCLAAMLGLRWFLQKRGRPSIDQPKRISRLMSVVLGNLDRNRNHFALAGIGIVVGIATFVFFISLGEGVRKIVLGEIFPIGQLEVVPPKVQMAVGPIQLGGDTKTITDETVEKIRQIPGVKAAFPKMKVSFPARAWGGKSFIGKNAGADLIADGVDPELVAADVVPGKYPFQDLEAVSCQSDTDCGTGATCGPEKMCVPRSCTKDEECGEDFYCDLGDPEWPSYKPTNDCHKPIPVLISSRFFELMNTTFLPANGFPKVNRDYFVNRLTFSIYLGHSNLKDAKKGRKAFRKAIIVGFSPRAIPVGLTVPLSYVKRWNAEYSDDISATSFHSVLVEVEDKNYVTSVAEEIKTTLGLDIEDSGAEKAGLVITIITLIFSLISVSIVGIAAINIMHTFLMLVSERKREIGILRSLGASRGDVRGMLLTEAAIVGFIAGTLGVLLAYDITMLIDYVNTTSLIPDFPFKPKSYFSISIELVMGALLFAVGCCLVGAYLPARNAAAVDPARALTAL